MMDRQKVDQLTGRCLESMAYDKERDLVTLRKGCELNTPYHEATIAKQ